MISIKPSQRTRLQKLNEMQSKFKAKGLLLKHAIELGAFKKNYGFATKWLKKWQVHFHLLRAKTSLIGGYF